MDIKTKFKYIGYLDLCSSSLQIGVSMSTTILSICYPLEEDRKSKFFSIDIWPVLNVGVTMILLMINLVQMQTAVKLIWAGEQEVSTKSMKIARANWTCINMMTSLVAYIWFPCFGMVINWQQNWSMTGIMVSFLMVAVSRGLCTWGMRGIKFDADIEIPDFPQDLMQVIMEMQQERRWVTRTPMREENWV